MSRNLDLRQDFRVGWHSKSSLQVWWWSEVSRCPPQPVDEPHRRPDELHPPLSEPHRECADVIFWYLESSDHHQTYRNYSKYYHTPISSFRSGFWNVRRFFTSWLLNLSLDLKGELWNRRTCRNTACIVFFVAPNCVRSTDWSNRILNLPSTRLERIPSITGPRFSQIELKLSSQEVWILKLSSQEVKNRRTFQNPDLRLDFDVGWHSKSSLQVWSRSAVSKWPKIASAHLIFSKDGMISAVWVMIFAVRAIIFGDFSMRRWL